MNNENQKQELDQVDESRRKFVKKAGAAAAAVPAVALLSSLRSTPLSAEQGYNVI